MNVLLKIKNFIIAGVVAAMLGFFGMGLLGLGLYYFAYPLLAPFYGDINDWHGDDSWPIMIVTGLSWSIFFPIAGLADLRLREAGIARLPRILAWLAILWLGAGLIWHLFLLASLNGMAFTAFRP